MVKKIHEEIASKKLPSGELLEMLYKPKEEKTLFAVYKDENISYAESFVVGEKTYVPLNVENSLLKNGNIIFPSAVSEHGSSKELLEEVKSFLHKYVQIPEQFELISSYYILFSWLHDRFSELPYLRVLGDYGSGKTRFLQTIGHICYKPMFLNGGASSSAIFRTIDSVKGTLILDEADFGDSDTKSDIAKILNCGFAKNMPIVKSETHKDNFRPRSFDIFGPKVIGGRVVFKDEAIESRCFSSYMETRTREDLPDNLTDEFYKEAQELRNKLVNFRFRNFYKEFHLCSPIKNVQPRLRQIATPLLSIVEDEEDQTKIIAFLKDYNQQIIENRGYSFEAEILRAIIDVMPEDSEPTIGRITNRANEILDNIRDCNPRAIGHLIRNSFRLKTIRKSDGHVIIECDENRKIIEKLKLKFGITREGEIAVSEVNVVSVERVPEEQQKLIADVFGVNQGDFRDA